MDLDNGKFKILPIENIKQFRGNPFDLETEWENCLYAVEMDGKYMCRYQLDTGHVKYIEINCGIRKDGNLPSWRHITIIYIYSTALAWLLSMTQRRKRYIL